VICDPLNWINQIIQKATRKEFQEQLQQCRTAEKYPGNRGTLAIIVLHRRKNPRFNSNMLYYSTKNLEDV
jgi:hypothetical protein